MRRSTRLLEPESYREPGWLSFSCCVTSRPSEVFTPCISFERPVVLKKWLQPTQLRRAAEPHHAPPLMTSDKTIRATDLRLLDDLFEMRGGYVLDFTNQTSAEFFKDEL